MADNSSSFKTARRSDNQMMRLVNQAMSKHQIQVTTVAIHTAFGNVISGALEDIVKNIQYEVITKNDSILIERMIWSSNIAQVAVVRIDTETSDKVAISMAGNNANSTMCLELLFSLKESFGELTHAQSLQLFGAQVQAHYEMREAELVRLQKIAESFLGEAMRALNQQSSVMHDELQRHRTELDQDASAKRVALESDMKQKAAALESREADLKKRIEEVDSRAARYARRAAAKELHASIGARGQSFALTAGTRNLRRPVWVATLVMLTLFGCGFGALLWNGAAVGKSDLDYWIKIGCAGVGLSSTFVFFIRWSNRWFEQHSREEFRLKRLEIDLQRATWAVELAQEWQDEGAEMPRRLLDRVTRNLFTFGEADPEVLHPLDQLAGQLLGSAKSAKIKTPALDLEFDQKGVRKAGEAASGG